MKKLLLSILLLAVFNANAALLFKSNFGPGVVLNQPTNYFPTGLEMHSTWPCGVGVSCYGK